MAHQGQKNWAETQKLTAHQEPTNWGADNAGGQIAKNQVE
jgi:hypothetical protein